MISTVSTNSYQLFKIPLHKKCPRTHNSFEEWGSQMAVQFYYEISLCFLYMFTMGLFFVKLNTKHKCIGHSTRQEISWKFLVG